MEISVAEIDNGVIIESVGETDCLVFVSSLEGEQQFELAVGDSITVKSSSKSVKKIKEQLEANPNYTTQGWLQLDVSKPAATITALPSRDDVQLPIEEQLVVEFFSKWIF